MRRLFLAAAVFLGIFGDAVLPSARADVVLPGYDLFTTSAGTSFQGVPFQGVPLGTFNFGGTVGVQNTGTTDTIIQRLDSVSSPSGTTRLLMNALQLESSVPTNLGLGVGFYFITLQSARPTGGPASTGSMTINFAPNTFSSSLDVFFDVRFGSLNGPIAQSSDLVLTSSGTPWQHPPTGTLLIAGANYKLNGTDTTEDFWPVAPFQEIHPNGAVHVVQDPQPTVPEPGSLALAGIGSLIGMGLSLRKRRRAAAGIP
jgi:hypothetical protein